MPFPKVTIKTTDETYITQNTQTYNTFYAGFFDRGPENEATSVSSILDFKVTFGKPTSENLTEWMQIYNYFAYNNSCIYLTRVIGENSTLATSKGPAKSLESFVGVSAKTKGSWGNGLSVVLSESGNQTIVNVYLNNILVETTTTENPAGLETEYVILNVSHKGQLDYNAKISLSGGYSEPPTQQQIADAYEDFGSREDLNLSLILANPEYEYPALKLAETKNAMVFSYSDSVKNVSDKIVYYYGTKKQKNPFNGKTIEVPITGDVLGIRSNLMNTEGIGVSHCKRSQSLLNVVAADILNLEELYNKGINSIGKMDNAYFVNSESTPTGKNATIQIILNELTKELASLSNYFVFEMNDDITRSDFRKKINARLENYKDSGYITAYQSTCDLSNQNSSEPNALYIDVAVQMPGIIETIDLRFTAQALS